jgi:hypothetical protein
MMCSRRLSHQLDVMVSISGDVKPKTLTFFDRVNDFFSSILANIVDDDVGAPRSEEERVAAGFR